MEPSKRLSRWSQKREPRPTLTLKRPSDAMRATPACGLPSARLALHAGESRLSDDSADGFREHERDAHDVTGVLNAVCAPDLANACLTDDIQRIAGE